MNKFSFKFRSHLYQIYHLSRKQSPPSLQCTAKYHLCWSLVQGSTVRAVAYRCTTAKVQLTQTHQGGGEARLDLFSQIRLNPTPFLKFENHVAVFSFSEKGHKKCKCTCILVVAHRYWADAFPVNLQEDLFAKKSRFYVMFNMQGQGQQSFFSSVNLHKICGCSDMAWLGVCARCTGIAAQLQRRQNVKEGGKRSVPLASTFTGGEQGLMHSWYLSQSPAVTHLFQVAYHFSAMNRLLTSCTTEMKLTWGKLMLQMGHPKWQISGTGAWDVAIEDWGFFMTERVLLRHGHWTRWLLEQLVNRERAKVGIKGSHLSDFEYEVTQEYMYETKSWGKSVTANTVGFWKSLKLPLTSPLFIGNNVTDSSVLVVTGFPKRDDEFT